MARQPELQEAIHRDFRKNAGETDLTEIYPVISEINHAIRHLASWMRPQRVKTPLALWGTSSEIRYEPKGMVLILSPWNYPFNLLMSPLVAAIASGNCVMMKPSSKVPQTARFLKSLIDEVFPENEIALIEGSSAVADSLLELPFDHIFFTGSPRIGKTVMQAAANHLASVTLELGGKSPAVIDETADIKTATERLLWGKFLNAGQTCVAPDYLLIHESRLGAFLNEAKRALTKRYGPNEGSRQQSPDFCRLVSTGHLEGLKKILADSINAGAKIETGGAIDDSERYLAPTILTGVTPESPIMKEEIFGPILPVITFRSVPEAISLIQSKEKPLALYVFSSDARQIESLIRNTTSGGTCVNTLIIHLGNPHLPFGGVGMSGMGNYHGFYGFKTFSHERAVLRQGWPDILKFFYPPYTPTVRKLIDLLTRYF